MTTTKILTYGAAAAAVWWLFLRRRPPGGGPVGNGPERDTVAKNPPGLVRGAA
jgi:hypothetical protein